MKKPVAFFCMVTLWAVSTVSFAEDTIERKALSEKSLAGKGFGSSVLTLTALPGDGKEAVFAAMVARLEANRLIAKPQLGTLRASFNQSSDEDKIQAWGDGWNLSVHHDGTVARYLNWGLREESASVNTIHQKISTAELVELGRRFIAENLAEFVKLGHGEEMVPLYSSYELDGGADSRGNLSPEPVVGNIIVFGRRVNGVDVLGAGSKVSIMFTHDRKPMGFGINWPQYRATGTSLSISANRIIAERASSYNIAKAGERGIVVDRYECGYYDRGASSRDEASVIQPACMVFYSAKSDGVGNSYMDAIPAADEPVRDAGWRQTAAIQRLGDTCAKSPLSDAILKLLKD